MIKKRGRKEKLSSFDKDTFGINVHLNSDAGNSCDGIIEELSNVGPISLLLSFHLDQLRSQAPLCLPPSRDEKKKEPW